MMLFVGGFVFQCLTHAYDQQEFSDIELIHRSFAFGMVSKQDFVSNVWLTWISPVKEVFSDAWVLPNQIRFKASFLILIEG